MGYVSIPEGIVLRSIYFDNVQKIVEIHFGDSFLYVNYPQHHEN